MSPLDPPDDERDLMADWTDPPTASGEAARLLGDYFHALRHAGFSRREAFKIVCISAAAE